MPGVGEQHNYAAANPFEEKKPHVSEYTAAEIATLSSRLGKQLGPEYISSRSGPGGNKVHYLSAHKCINLANEVFGFNGWSSSIQNIQVDFVDETEQGRVTLGLSVILRVTLRDGTYHEDIGYGHIENCKGKAAAFEKAKKEGTTDALKRALRSFGDLLGNCVYDKEYLAKVTKLKPGPARFDPDNLHRHHEFEPVRKDRGRGPAKPHVGVPSVKREALAETEETQATIKGFGEDEFGSDDFDAVDFAVSEGDHPDEIMLDANLSSGHHHGKPDSLRKQNASEVPTREPGNTPRLPSPCSRFKEPQTPSIGRELRRPPPLPLSKPPDAPIPNAAPPHPNHQNTTLPPQSVPPSLDSSYLQGHGPPVGFFTARAAESLQAGPNPSIKAPLFNPHLESPSIRKTVGVDHTRTKPVNRDLTEAAAAAPSPLPPPSAAITAGGGLPQGNMMVNPQTDRARRVGMPTGPGSPLQNRSSYKPPQMMKRPAAVEGQALKDITAASINAGVGDSVDAAKRQKIGVVASGESHGNNDGTLRV